MGDNISRSALIKQIEIDSDGSPGWYGDTWQFMKTIAKMPSTDRTIIRAKTLMTEKDFDKWAENIREQDGDIICIPRNAEVCEPIGMWIPCSERLPDQHRDVLVCGVDMISGETIYSVKVLDVDVWRPLSAPSCHWLAWMPLPEPYKGGAE